jgi:DNA-binding XRE family transcriptional regulator
MTATEAAKVLGISRKTYYKWEQRGLAALLGGLQDQPFGRKEKSELVKREEELEKQLAQVKQEKEILQKKMALREIAHQLESAERLKKK